MPDIQSGTDTGESILKRLFHRRVALPRGLEEKEAISHVQAYLKSRGVWGSKWPARILYPDLKEIRIGPNKYRVFFFPPRIVVKKTHLEFLSLPRGIPGETIRTDR